MKRKIFSVVLTAMLLVSVITVLDLGVVGYAEEVELASIIASGECGERGNNLIWTLDDEGTLTISGTGMMDAWYGKDQVPWHNKRPIKNVIIEYGVTNIGNYAFYEYSELRNITILNSVISIGSSAFYTCNNIEKIDIPDSVTNICAYAFNHCEKLTTIIMGNGIKNIGSYAFSVCQKLSTVYYIGTQADWNNITIDSYNSPLLNANKIFLLEKGSVPFEGAQIRTEGTQGLRYIFKIPKALSENCTEFGSVVMPKKYLGENTLEIGFVTNVNGKEYAAKKVPAAKLFGEDEEYIYYTVCITHITKSKHSDKFVAVPYVITKNADGTDRITYGEEQEMTVNEVLQGLSN